MTSPVPVAPSPNSHAHDSTDPSGSSDPDASNDAFKSAFEAKLGQTVPALERSFISVLARVIALSDTGLYKYAANRILQALAITATGDNLDVIGRNYGVYRIAGTPAEINVVFTGTTGATLCATADYMVSSGLHDIVLAIGFEKLQEGHTTGGITNMADPLWARQLQTGALTGMTAMAVIEGVARDSAGPREIMLARAAPALAAATPAGAP